MCRKVGKSMTPNKQYSSRKPMTTKKKEPVATGSITKNIATVKFRRAINPIEPEYVFSMPKGYSCGDLKNDNADKTEHELYKINTAHIFNKLGYLLENMKDVQVVYKDPMVGELRSAAEECCMNEEGRLTVKTKAGVSFYKAFLCSHVKESYNNGTTIEMKWLNGESLTITGKYTKPKK